MLKLFYTLAMAVIILSSSGMATGYGAPNEKEYIKKTNQAYKKTVVPYLQYQKKIKKYLNERYPKREGQIDPPAMQKLFANILMLESLPNNEKKYQMGLDFNTNRLAAIAQGAYTKVPEMEYWDADNPPKGKLYIGPSGWKRSGKNERVGTKYGISVKNPVSWNMSADFTGEAADSDVLLAAAIHTGLNDRLYKNYIKDDNDPEDAAGIRFSAEESLVDGSRINPNHILEIVGERRYSKLMLHRSMFFALLYLAVVYEQQINLLLAGEKYTPDGRPSRKIITKSDLESGKYDEAWEQAVRTTQANLLKKSNYLVITRYDSNLENNNFLNDLDTTLNAIREPFQKYFLAITAITNDRKWGIIRDKKYTQPQRKKQKFKGRATSAKAVDRKDIKKNLETLSKAFDDTDDKTTKPATVRLSVNAGGTGSGGAVTFSNSGGPEVYKSSLLNNNKTASVVLPFYAVDFRKNSPEQVQRQLEKDADILYLNMKLQSDSDLATQLDEAAKIGRANDMRLPLNQGRIFLLSSAHPEVDGIFVASDNGEEITFDMLASPFESNYSKQIIKKPGGIGQLTNFVEAMFSSGEKVSAKTIYKRKQKTTAGMFAIRRAEAFPYKGFTVTDRQQIKELPSTIKGQLLGNAKYVIKNKQAYVKVVDASRGKAISNQPYSEAEMVIILKFSPEKKKSVIKEAVENLLNKGWFAVVRDGKVPYIFYSTFGKKADDRLIYATNIPAGTVVDKRTKEAMKIKNKISDHAYNMKASVLGFD